MGTNILVLPFWTCLSAAAAVISTVLTVAIFIASQESANRVQKADFYIKITDRYNSQVMVLALREVVLFHNRDRENFAAIFGDEHARQTDLAIKLNDARAIVALYFKQVVDMYEHKLIDARLARMLCNFYGLNVYYEVVVPMGLARTDVTHTRDLDVMATLKTLRCHYGDGKVGGAP